MVLQWEAAAPLRGPAKLGSRLHGGVSALPATGSPGPTGRKAPLTLAALGPGPAGEHPTFSGGGSGGDSPRPLSERMQKFIWQ